ncbi:6,7-dimethyl-8-ribityllumazine synthase [Paracoccus sp. 1_MG-2023]|uniref:6,7-dimethyl-8-ribityllumazine synthase n=1 Tax=unclassified Paracoccus (in: a-proteobacteria) TaxID=2688777 RepID=UPI001C09B55E|nr:MULTISPECIES: 6,7-dimethyl-8-ribityllumazine synthase [unclassified Paracoccus (in: a-proteobacteria)]MBU2957479.1 6,7-dimethyl-8-ribityllumazine synthase [Paracoccus sp. C2R09]MDO6669677.1 6,7-dimethyl-8-ribityllumazine synthase [Paracoccus sp. 1_MG-2023]
MASNTAHHELPLPHFDTAPRLLAVIAPYYKDIADDMLTGARATADAAGAALDVIEVPGALEIPTAVAMAAESGRYDGFVAIGCVIRGETTHYDTVCNDSSRGLTLLGLQGICLGNGILTVENYEQAARRADPTDMNKGGGAAAAALHLIALRRRFKPGGAPKAGHPDVIRLAGELEGQSKA